MRRPMLCKENIYILKLHCRAPLKTRSSIKISGAYTTKYMALNEACTTRRTALDSLHGLAKSNLSTSAQHMAPWVASKQQLQSTWNGFNLCAPSKKKKKNVNVNGTKASISISIFIAGSSTNIWLDSLAPRQSKYARKLETLFLNVTKGMLLYNSQCIFMETFLFMVN